MKPSNTPSDKATVTVAQIKAMQKRWQRRNGKGGEGWSFYTAFAKELCELARRKK